MELFTLPNYIPLALYGATSTKHVECLSGISHVVLFVNTKVSMNFHNIATLLSDQMWHFSQIYSAILREKNKIVASLGLENECLEALAAH